MATNQLQELTPAQAAKFEPEAKILAANGISQSLSFTMERKYLRDISPRDGLFHLALPSPYPKSMPSDIQWLKIEQIGRPIDNTPKVCFNAIQKILASCHLPNKTELVFLVKGSREGYNLFLGIRSHDTAVIDEDFTENLGHFIEGVWPGIKCSSYAKEIKTISDRIQKYRHIDAITGIPSMESEYKNIYPATIDTLLAGMRDIDFTYVVIASPIPTNDVDGILYQVRDFNGQAESLKSFNFSENTSSSIGKTLNRSKTITDSTNENTQSKSGWGMVGAGLMLASCLFPPAGAITTAIAIADGANTIAGGNLLADFTPAKTVGKSHSVATTEGVSDTYSEQQGKSISTNIVNKQIEAVSEHLFYHSKRFETGKAIGCWCVGVYMLCDDRHKLQSGSMQLKSIVSGKESIYEPVRIHHIDDVVKSVLPQTLACMSAPLVKISTPNGFFQHPLGAHFNDLRTVLTTKELSYLINFPLRSVPGISVIDSSPEFSLNSQKLENMETIDFGKLLYGGTPVNIPYHLTLSDLSKHTLLSGINGAGKTNTVMAILNAITDKLPFLIIEPAKTEYVDWAAEYNRLHPESPIDIYMPGCKTYRDKKTRQEVALKELKLNPFEPIWLDKEQDPNVLSHIDRLKSTFAAAFPMYDILPVLMEDLIYSIYQNKSTDWLGAEPVFGQTMPPTLNSMSVGVDKVISNRQYEARIEQNMKACLNTRIDSLMRGWKGKMLNTVHSTPWEDLFERPVIINLSYVGDDVDKGFFMALILQFLYEYRTALAELGRVDFNDNTCKHLTVIEEAHRVMMKCDKPDMPQYKTAMMFSNMLSEIRAYGEGMFLVDQVPTRLIPDAIKNTNTKITHRLVAEDDSKAIAEAMGLSKEQRKIIPKLMVGECIVSTSLTPDKHWVQVNKSK